MRILLFSILLLAFSPNSHAADRVYKKLDKLYHSDRDLCLAKAKKFMDRFEKNAIPHYFASVVYYDQSNESSTLRGMYLHINRSLHAARKFETLSSDSDKQLVHWDEHIASLKKRSERLITKLDKENQSDLSENLRSSFLKVPSFSDEEFAEPALATLSAERPEVVKNRTRIEGQLYGIPEGTEVFPAQSAEKEQQLLELINAERLKKGIPPLKWNEDLARASRYHATDLATQGYFDHHSYDRYGDELIQVAGPFERIDRFYKATAVNSENIAAGSENANGTYRQWYNSKGHYENMFNPDSRYIGIGMHADPGSPYGYYWVMSTAK